MYSVADIKLIFKHILFKLGLLKNGPITDF